MKIFWYLGLGVYTSEAECLPNSICEALGSIPNILPSNNYMIFYFVNIFLRMYSIMLFLPISSSFLFYFANNLRTFVFVLFPWKYLILGWGEAQW